MVAIRNIIIKPGYVRRTGTNRQVKVLGKSHRDMLDREFISYIERREKIKRFELLLKLWDGDVSAVQGLVEMGYKFEDRDIKALKQTLRTVKHMAEITLNDGEVRWVTLTNRGLVLIERILKTGYQEAQVTKYGSDQLEEIVASGIASMVIEPLPEPAKMFKNKTGKLFKYINETKLNLERYQILSKDSDVSITKENCLIYAFRMLGVKETLLKAVKLAFSEGAYIAAKDLKKISEITGKKITLYKYRNTANKIKKIVYGLPGLEELKIAIYQNHYFVYEESKYSMYSMKNYQRVKDLENFEKVVGFTKGKPRRTNKSKCNTLHMVRYLFDSGCFNDKHEKLVEIEGFEHKECVTEIPLNNIVNEQKPYEYNDKESEDYSIFYADTEAMVSEGEHLCLLTGIVKDGEKHVEICKYNPDKPNKHVQDMLSYADLLSGRQQKVIIYFHNLKYDLAVLKKHMHIIDICEKDGAIYSVKTIFRKRIIELRDSYKLFNQPLDTFGATFGLSPGMCKKEAIGYTYYKTTNMKKKKHRVSEYIKHIKEKDKELFMEILKSDPRFGYDGKYFRAMKYYKYYLKYDCLVLMNGFKVFESKIKDLTGLCIHDSLTISSLANKYFASRGSFTDLYTVCANIRDYLSKSIVGGRCTVLESAVKKYINTQLVDYDACSLYPSAIYRLCLEMGLPRGMAKRISGYTKEYLDTKDYYTVTVNITKINKKQQVPFISMKDESGILRYINEVPEGGYKCVIDKITLEDYIKFHEIEYEILDGVYWDEGFNKTFGQEIEKLYNKRLVEKAKAKNMKLTKDQRKSGDVMQGVIKLMLNSAYGKTIIKKSNVKKVILTEGPKLKSYVYNHFYAIKEMNKISDKQRIVKIDCVDDSSNLAHVGGLVLSYSKRIMNEVMNTANDNGIKVYYQDTDSMHIERSQIKKLEKLYEKEYKRKLNGQDMCNFHSDFSLEGADKGCEIYSTESYFLGKKCYIDKLECVNKDGSIVTGTHLRLKGVTDAGIKYTIKKGFNGDAMKMFEYLSTGEELDMPLNPKDSVSMCFTDTGVFNWETETFRRVIKF